MNHEQYCQRINALFRQLADHADVDDMDAVKLVFAELADTVCQHGPAALRDHPVRGNDRAAKELADLIEHLMIVTQYQPKTYQ